MDWIGALPVWLLALTIFGMRVIDVSLGTIRTITVVGGMISLSVALGFFESFLWLMAVQQAITRLNESPWPPVFYAGGFAMGDAVGIVLERKRVPEMLETAIELDSELCYTVECANDWRQVKRPAFAATGRRDVAKKK